MEGNHKKELSTANLLDDILNWGLLDTKEQCD
jgi:hypothetical protein